MTPAGGLSGRRRRWRLIALLIGSLAYWLLVCRIDDVAEPWDGRNYWRLWYPTSVAVAALAGCWLRQRGWSAGVIVTFAQWPVMWLTSRQPTISPIAPLMLAALALVPIAAATLGGGWRGRSPVGSN